MHVISTDPQVAGQIAAVVLACEIDAGHVHTVSQHTSQAKASAPLAGLDNLDHFPVSNDKQLGVGFIILEQQRDTTVI